MRTRTPPEIKWLLVERATLVGDISRLQEKRDYLSQRISRLEAKVHALDTALRMADERVRADAAGVIRRTALEYGRRGALKEFVVSTLQVSTTGLTARAVAILARDHFGIQFTMPTELTEFLENSVRPQLKKLRSEGFVTNLAGDGPEGMLWLWKSRRPSLSDLGAHSVKRRADETPHGIGREVAGK